MQIFRTSPFEKALKKLGASATDIEKLSSEIANNPDAGDVIRGLQGVRKIRFSMKGKGKSGGGRCIYLALILEDTAYLLLAYDKSVQSDLTIEQRKLILAIVEDIQYDS